MYCEYAFKYLVNIVVQEIWKSHKATYMYKTSMAWWKAVGGEVLFLKCCKSKYYE